MTINRRVAVIRVAVIFLSSMQDKALGCKIIR